jgi:hypothetical protein
MPLECSLIPWDATHNPGRQSERAAREIFTLPRTRSALSEKLFPEWSIQNSFFALKTEREIYELLFLEDINYCNLTNQYFEFPLFLAVMNKMYNLEFIFSWALLLSQVSRA